MAAFFLAQPALLAAERRLRLESRVWTLGCLGLLSPLFLEPFLQAFGL